MDGNYASVGYVNFLFGIFCAEWAKSSGRRPWLWFFMGLLFAPITGIVLASKHAKDVDAGLARATPAARPISE